MNTIRNSVILGLVLLGWVATWYATGQRLVWGLLCFTLAAVYAWLNPRVTR